MIVIVGTADKRSDLAEGEFFCPACQANRPYLHQRIYRSLTLFFIPIVSLGEVIHCPACSNDFDLGVIEQSPAVPEVETLTHCPACGHDLSGARECPDCGLFVG